jgi:hypothetical protein
MDETTSFTRISAVRETPVYLSKFPGSYDGQFYAQLAHHPLLDSPELAPAMDTFAYRARRILPSMAAWLLAAGNPFLIFNAYCVVNILAWLGLSGVLWKLLEVRDARTWIAWFAVMFSAGALFSVARALTDLVALTFIATALLLVSRKRRTASALSLSAGALCRETALLALVDAVCVRHRDDAQRGRSAILWDRFRLACVAAAPLAGWCLYVRWRVGPTHDVWGNFAWPFFGLVGKWASIPREFFQTEDLPLALFSLLTLAGLTFQALYIAVTFDRTSRWSRLGAAYLFLAASLSAEVWEGLPGAACRVLLPMTLAFNLLVAQRRASFAWILIGNLTVFSGLLFLRDVPWQDDTELSTSRSLSSAGILREGPGWYGRETTGSHTWIWAASFGELEIEHWPQSAKTAEVRFSMRSVEPTLVTISGGDTVLLEKTLGKEPEIVTVQVPMVAGHAVIRFSSSDKPVGVPGDKRLLNFQVYDPEIVLEPLP